MKIISLKSKLTVLSMQQLHQLKGGAETISDSSDIVIVDVDAV